jgi:hypothetical protein
MRRNILYLNRHLAWLGKNDLEQFAAWLHVILWLIVRQP